MRSYLRIYQSMQSNVVAQHIAKQNAPKISPDEGIRQPLLGLIGMELWLTVKQIRRERPSYLRSLK